MIPAWHLLHPAAVHFPIALLLLGWAAAGAAALRRGPAWLPELAAWLLWLGTLSAWAALGLGVLAEEYAPHVPAAWEVLEEHEALAWWTAGAFTALSAWRFWLWRRPPAGVWPERALLAAWLAALGLLLATAYHGGELVFRFGMGVVTGD